jgi:hypothetical protein
MAKMSRKMAVFVTRRTIAAKFRSIACVSLRNARQAAGWCFDLLHGGSGVDGFGSSTPAVEGRKAGTAVAPQHR